MTFTSNTKAISMKSADNTQICFTESRAKKSLNEIKFHFGRKFLLLFLLITFLQVFDSFGQACSSYTTWSPGMFIGPGSYCGSNYGGTTVTSGGRLYTHRGYCSSTGPGTWDFQDIGACTSCTNRTVAAASSSPTACINTAMTSITHATTQVTGIASSSGLPSGVTASYASNVITISGTPTVAGTYNYTITPTSSCGSATATGTITVVSAAPTITGTTPASRCTAGTVTLGATASSGTINWYAALTGGASLGSGTSYTTASISSTTTYYVSATNSCGTTASRTSVVATITGGSVGPGGITDQLLVWLKADAGVSSIGTSWQDQSCNANNYTTVTGPTVISNDINSNPAIQILSGGFNGPAGAAIGSSWTVFSVHRLLASDADGRFIEAHSGNYLLANWSTYSKAIYLENNPAQHNTGIATNSGTQTTRVYCYSRNNSTGSIVARVDGDLLNTFTSTNSASGVIWDLNQGTYASESSHSRIAEFIVFNKALSATEILKVEAYLATKYGLVLSNADGGTGGDYVSTGGTTYWDASASTAYSNEIVVIGKDNNTALTQKQSKSLDDSVRVYVGSFASSNTSNAGTITNNESFLVLGHNGGKLKSRQAILSEKPSGVYSRFEREWKVVNTNFTDNFSLRIQWDSVSTINLSDLRLLVDDDGNFSNATVYSSANGLTFSIGSIIVSGISTSMIPMNSTKYITIASANSTTTLPVNLLTFDATLEDGFVNLTWQTASEINNEKFILEKSFDANNWFQIAEIKGAGNSNNILNYSFVDDALILGIQYYRLTQVDFDGTKETFEIIDVAAATTAIKDLNVFPIPMKDEVKVMFNASKEGYVRFKIYSESGQEIYSALVATVNGENVFNFNTSQFSEGIYLFKIEKEDGSSISKKVLK